MVFYLFFFFQAEDGIRDKLVTGVQTCALPILVENSAIQNALQTCLKMADEIGIEERKLVLVTDDVAMLLERSEEHTSELQSLAYLVCRLLLEKKKKKQIMILNHTPSVEPPPTQ